MSAEINVDTLTPVAKCCMAGIGRPLLVTSNSIVMLKTVALEMAWKLRASKTGKDREMRIAFD